MTYIKISIFLKFKLDFNFIIDHRNHLRVILTCFRLNVNNLKQVVIKLFQR